MFSLFVSNHSIKSRFSFYSNVRNVVGNGDSGRLCEFKSARHIWHVTERNLSCGDRAHRHSAAAKIGNESGVPQDGNVRRTVDIEVNHALRARSDCPSAIGDALRNTVITFIGQEPVVDLRQEQEAFFCGIS